MSIENWGYEESSDFAADYAKSKVMRMCEESGEDELIGRAIKLLVDDDYTDVVSEKIKNASNFEELKIFYGNDKINYIAEMIKFIDDKYEIDKKIRTEFYPSYSTIEQLEKEVEKRKWLDKAIIVEGARFESISVQIPGYGYNYLDMNLIWRYGLNDIPMNGSKEYNDAISKFKKFLEENCDIDFLLKYVPKSE